MFKELFLFVFIIYGFLKIQISSKMAWNLTQGEAIFVD